MEHAQHDEAFAVISVLKYIRSIEDLQDNLPVFAAARNCPSEQWMIRKNLSLVDDFFSDDFGKPRMIM